MKRWILPVCAAVIHGWMALGAASEKSGTFDEFVHVTAGHSYWAFDDFRLNPENGNWPQRWVGLPSVMQHAAFPSLSQEAWQHSDMWALSDQFFFAMGNDADAMLAYARGMVALVGSALGLLVFAWSLNLFGILGGWISLLLYVFSPTMLAHGALATSDVFAAAFVTLSTWALWKALERPSPARVGLSVIAMSGAFLSKASSPILVLVALAMLIVRAVAGPPLVLELRARRIELSRPAARRWTWAGLTAIHFAGVLAMIWASYGFRYGAMAAQVTGADAFLDPWSSLLAEPTTAARLVDWGRSHHILPEAYLYGLLSVSAYAPHRVAFMNGTVSTGGGWRTFFPYAALVKTTIPALLLLAAAVIALLKRARRAVLDPEARDGVYQLAPIFILVVTYGLFAIASPLNIGYRHLLPIIPVMIILAGAAADHANAA